MIMVFELIWYTIMAIIYIIVGAYGMHIYMSPLWEQGFDDGWRSCKNFCNDPALWVERGYTKGWHDCTETNLVSFERGFDAGWHANEKITEDKIKETIRKMDKLS